MLKSQRLGPEVNAALLSLKPRQVVLSQSASSAHSLSTKLAEGMVAVMALGNDTNQGLAPSSGNKNMLARAVARYLEEKKFYKTLKKFRSEAKLVGDAYEDAYDLEVLFANHFDKCDENNNPKSRKGTDGILKETKEEYANGFLNLSENHVMTDQSEAPKVKEKKKSKKSSDASNDDVHMVSKNPAKVEYEDHNIKTEVDAKSIPLGNEAPKVKEKKKSKKSSKASTGDKVVNEDDAKPILKGNQEHKLKKGKKSLSDCQVEVEPKTGTSLTDKQTDAQLTNGNERCKEDCSTVKKKTKKERKDAEPVGTSNQTDAQAKKDRASSKCIGTSDPEPVGTSNQPDAQTNVLGKTLTDEQADAELIYTNESCKEELPATKKKRKEKKDHVTSKSNETSDVVPVGTPNQTEEIVTNKKDKSLKKRKREAVVNDDTNVADESIQELKRKKSSHSEEVDGSQVVEAKGQEESKKIDNSLPHDIGFANGNHQLTTDKPSASPVSNKATDDANQAASVKRFQRVIAEEVIFSDDRLKDNSYWAKDGAEIGYGAKAQEVLGQVRGKGFRHEKTKKKRGSYRGGQIDQQSHSIKFNFSDDE